MNTLAKSLFVYALAGAAAAQPPASGSLAQTTPSSAAPFEPCDDGSTPTCPGGAALKEYSFPPCADGKPVCAWPWWGGPCGTPSSRWPCSSCTTPTQPKNPTLEPDGSTALLRLLLAPPLLRPFPPVPRSDEPSPQSDFGSAGSRHLAGEERNEWTRALPTLRLHVPPCVRLHSPVPQPRRPRFARVHGRARELDGRLEPRHLSGEGGAGAKVYRFLHASRSRAAAYLPSSYHPRPDGPSETPSSSPR